MLSASRTLARYWRVAFLKAEKDKDLCHVLASFIDANGFHAIVTSGDNAKMLGHVYFAELIQGSVWQYTMIMLTGRSLLSPRKATILSSQADLNEAEPSSEIGLI